MTNRKPRQLTGTDFDEWGTRISPDGRWITYVSDESGRRETYVTAFPSLGERQQVSTNGSTSDGMWTSGGREIIYITPDRKAMSVRVTVKGNALEVSTPQELFTLPRRGSADVTADGQRFLVYEPADAPSVLLSLVTNWR